LYLGTTLGELTIHGISEDLPIFTFYFGCDFVGTLSIDKRANFTVSIVFVLLFRRPYGFVHDRKLNQLAIALRERRRYVIHAELSDAMAKELRETRAEDVFWPAIFAAIN
jgi:hypothetical protein